MHQNPDRQKMRSLLDESKNIAVIGLSDKPYRTSYQVSEAMQKAGYKIIPVNPEIESTLGENAYSSLSEVKERIDIINVFRRSEYLPGVARESLNIDAKGFWAQQGVYHPDVPEILKKKDMLVIMDNCIKVAHAVLR